MNRETLEKTGAAAFGGIWQSNLAERLDVNDRTIRRWLENDNAPDRISGELVNMLSIRKIEIDNAIKTLESGIESAGEADLSQTVYTVSDAGELLYNTFDTMSDAENWINALDDEDAYLCKVHAMTLAEYNALLTIEHYSDVYDPSDILREIKDTEHNASNKSEFEIYCDIAYLNDDFWGKEYYKYYLAHELNLHVFGAFETDNKTKSYKDFVLAKISRVHEFLAKL